VCTTDYPFDVQRLRIRFTVQGANLFTCNTTDHTMAVVRPLFPLNQTSEGEEKLLPFTRQWLLAGRPQQVISSEHPIVDGNTRYDMYAATASCPAMHLVVARLWSYTFWARVGSACSLTAHSRAHSMSPRT
jgi:hypothetical protein